MAAARGRSISTAAKTTPQNGSTKSTVVSLSATSVATVAPTATEQSAWREAGALFSSASNRHAVAVSSVRISALVE